MASAVKKCRVCGKDYEACRSANRTAGVFRWQEVACSPECGTIYLQKINESRGAVSAQVDAQRKTKHRKQSAAQEIEPVVETETLDEAAPTIDEVPALPVFDEPVSEAPVDME